MGVPSVVTGFAEPDCASAENHLRAALAPMTSVWWHESQDFRNKARSLKNKSFSVA
jgi:hypothetical protein